ncbi:MAG: MBL fold metallo-hydrolase [Deinococcales bacterium]
MIIERYALGPLAANAYLLVESDAAVVVDPGGDPGPLLRALAAHGAQLAAVWLTHADFDHVGGLAALVRAWPVPVHLHPADLPLLRGAASQAALFGVPIEPPPDTTVDLTDGQTLELAGTRARCLHTPGHTPGHVAFYLPGADAVLSGDALFRGSIGRTDRPFGDGALLVRSIREQLLTLPDDTRVLPGHGPETTILTERGSNPFLAGR